jgi:hypothetical protein
MKKILILLLLINHSLFAQNINDLIKEGEKAVNNANSNKGAGLTNDEIVGGLKEALTIGSKNAGDLASKVNGYYKNPKIKIPFPKEARDVESTLRNLGMNKEVDQFVMSLNRAAEDAAKQSIPIFSDAVKKITISDGLSILRGDDHAATEYLKSKTQSQLKTQFKPVIDKSVNKMNVGKYWKVLADAYNKMPFVKKVNPNLTDYTTGKALDGLFYLVAQQELKIRKDPAAQITDLLKKVFGGK